MADPLDVLRSYQDLAPWNLRGLAAVTSAILQASRVTPINAAASTMPSERTIRFYVTRGIVKPPQGRGTAATYSYRHLLQVLAVKLGQMDGDTLDAIRGRFEGLTGDELEKKVAAALGPTIPTPDHLELATMDASRGRTGRTVFVGSDDADRDRGHRLTSWHRIAVDRGIELHLAADHPLAEMPDLEERVAEAVREAIRVVGGRRE